MNKIIFSWLLLLCGVLPAFAQEQAPPLDPAFGIKPFAMDDLWIIDVKQTTDGGFYVAGAWEGIARLDAAGNKLWSAPYTDTGNYVDMPGSIAVDDADNVYAGIYEYPAGKIIKYDPAGNQVKTYAVDDVIFGVVFNKELSRLYAVTGGGIILMLDSDLNFISSAACGEPGSVVWAEGGIGLDTAGNVYISGWSAIGTTRRLIGLKYTAALTPLWEYSEPIGSNPFTAGEVIPEGGMYLIREYRGSEPKLLNISGDGVKLWETVVPEDYHYYKGVDKAGNFYGATWDENNDWAVTVGKYAYENGAVLWSLPELFSGETDDILADAQDRLYTFGSLMDPVGDDELFVARYGGDGVAPAAVSDLAVTVVSSDSITLSWTAPGDDGITGMSSSYDLRYTTIGAITEDGFNAATQAQGEPVPQAAGGAETFMLTGLTPGTTYFFGVRTTDEAGNVSGLSNSPQGVTTAVPKDKYELSGSTVPVIVPVNAWSAPLASLVNIFGSTIPAREIGVDFTISTYPAGAAGFFLSKSSEATNPQGQADVLLRLGDIPAEYGVTATCNTCEASASSVTFTCCGKLPNDDFKQSDLSWGTTHYDNICSTEPPNTGNYRPVYTCSAPIFNNPQYQKYKFTVRAKGCALSSLATLINFYKETHDLAVSSTTPLLLNVFLGNNVASGTNCYSKQGAVSFECVKKYSSNIKFNEKSDIEEIELADLVKAATEDVHKGAPVILKISNPTHFVLAIGKCGNKFIVSDPGSSASENILYNPEGPRPLIGIRRFKYSE